MGPSGWKVVALAVTCAVGLTGCCCCGGGEPLTPEEEAKREADRAVREAAEAEAFAAAEARSSVHYDSLQVLHTLVDRDAAVASVTCPDDDIRAVGDEEVGRRAVWTADYDGLPGVTATSGPWDWLESGAMQAVRELDEKPDSIFRDGWIEDIGAPENQHLIVFVASSRGEPGTADPWFEGGLLVVDLASRSVICQVPLAIPSSAGTDPKAFESAGNTALETITGELRFSLED